MEVETAIAIFGLAFGVYVRLHRSAPHMTCDFGVDDDAFVGEGHNGRVDLHGLFFFCSLGERHIKPLLSLRIRDRDD